MTWRGTFLLLLAGILAATLLPITLRTRTRPADAPLLGITPGETTGIVITGAGSTTALEKRGDVWWITRPLLDRAEPAKVSKLLGAAADAVPLDKLRPSDLKGSLSPESLDLRPVKRSLCFQGRGTHTLLLGSEGATSERIYARVDSDPSVYLISSETAVLAFQPGNDLRDPRPFPAQAEQLSEVVLRQQGGYRELGLRRKGRDWMIESPLRTRADAKALSDWMGGILGSRILRWMPPETESASCGLDVPEATLTLREQRNEPVLLELGKPVPGTPGARYARTPGRPGLFVLGGVDPWLAVTPASLRLRHPSPVELDSVDRILITRGGHPATVSRKPQTDDWLCGERTIPGAAVTGWCARLQQTTASSFETATPDHLAARGIDPGTPGTVSVRFAARLSQNSAEESAGEMTLAEWTIGTPSPDGTIALREGQADDLMILPSGSIIPLLEEAVGCTEPPKPASPAPSASPSAQ